MKNFIVIIWAGYVVFVSLPCSSFVEELWISRKERRAELIEILGKNFRCYEEVRLRHALFGRRVLRADVIAVPVEASFLEFRLHSKLSSRHIISNLNFGYTLSDKRQIMSMDALSRS